MPRIAHCAATASSYLLRHAIVDRKKPVFEISHTGLSFHQGACSFGVRPHRGGEHRRYRVHRGRCGDFQQPDRGPHGRSSAGQRYRLPSPMPGANADNRHKAFTIDLRQAGWGGSQMVRGRCAFVLVPIHQCAEHLNETRPRRVGGIDFRQLCRCGDERPIGSVHNRCIPDGR